VVIISYSCQTCMILKEMKHWETVLSISYDTFCKISFNLYFHKVLCIKLYCMLTKKTSVCYTHKIKLEGVIIRLKMIHVTLHVMIVLAVCNKIDIKLCAVSAVPSQELHIVFNNLSSPDVRLRVEGNVRPLLALRLDLVFSCTSYFPKIGGMAGIIESP